MFKNVTRMIGFLLIQLLILDKTLFFKFHLYRTRAIISRGLYIFYPIFHCIFIVERLILQKIYVLNKEILQFFGRL